MTRLHRRGAAALLALALTVASVLFAQSASAYGHHHKPTLSLASNTEPQGGTDTAYGAHFTPNSNVTLTLHSATVVVGHTTTDGNGSFTTNFTVPSNFPTGHHTVTAVNSKHKHASAALRVTGHHHGQRGVHVSNPTPPEGGSIVVSGSSCTPGATITVTLDGTTQLGQTTADSSGAYSITVKLPDGVTGHHQIVVSGGGCSGVEGIDIQSGGLVNTGVAVASIGGLGVLLLAAGGFALLVGRRRNAAV